MASKAKTPGRRTKPRKQAMKAKAEKPAADRVVFIQMQPSGVRVTEDNALTYSAVFGCVRIIAETLSSLAWHVMERLPGGGKQPVGQTAVDWILHTQANPEMSAGTFRETLVSNALLWGNGYAEIERDGAGRPVWLNLLPPDRMEVKRDEITDALFYRLWSSNGKVTDFPPGNIFHLKGLGFDGLVGYSVIRLAAQSIGLGLAMETSGSALFGNGARPNGILKYPNKAGPGVLDETEKRWMKQYGGPRNAQRIVAMDQGLDFVPISMHNNDAQWLEGRKFQTEEICRWFRVPPHKLADLSRATFSNIEHQSIEFVTDTILPWAKRLEQEADIKLFGRQGQGRFFTKLKIESLLRGDFASRWDGYTKAFDRGILCINEIREQEDMNGIGPDGDKRLVPLNMQLLEKAGEEPPAAPADGAPRRDDDEEPEDDGDAVPQNRLNGHGAKT